ncbi:MAG: quinolinate synthase NadA [Methanomicrobiales archaeon]|nr:quinolinate synthase NadA [Methanomicrobiales archaeon]
MNRAASSIYRLDQNIRTIPDPELKNPKIRDRIQDLKEERDAIILAHNYQIDEVQDIADFVGDSLELSRTASVVNRKVIVFCGVDFMAETAAILSPEKTVLLPAAEACCPMAEMIMGEDVRRLREQFPEAAVVAYVNTTAEVKAESDICCTSANAVKIIRSMDENQILFVPDRNLGLYVARFTEKEVLPWEGYCLVHDRYTTEEVTEAKKRHPKAELLVHPECRPEVIDCADHVYSTSGIIQYACSGKGEEYIIGTEVGILHRLRRLCPEKRCYPLSPHAVCANMKKTTLEKVFLALERMTPRITVEESIAVRARAAIERMLAIKE